MTPRKKAAGETPAKPTGRPTLLTPENEKLFFGALRVGNTITCASEVAGLSRRVVHKWLTLGRRDLRAGRSKTLHAGFVLKARKALADAEAHHVALIAAAASKGNWTASAWWLERRRHRAYSRKDRLTLDGDAKRPVVFTLQVPARPALSDEVRKLDATMPLPALEPGDDDA